jgi:hypothetical protein
MLGSSQWCQRIFSISASFLMLTRTAGPSTPLRSGREDRNIQTISRTPRSIRDISIGGNVLLDQENQSLSARNPVGLLGILTHDLLR